MCSNYSVTYGKRYRHFFTRAAEHMRVSNLTRKRLKNIDILATDASKCSLFVKESLLIKRVNPVVYRATNSLPLELFD